jgi:hypothetical protein
MQPQPRNQQDRQSDPADADPQQPDVSREHRRD